MKPTLLPEIAFSEATEYLERHLDSLGNKETGREILNGELMQFKKPKSKVHSIEGNGGVFYKMAASLVNRQGFPNFIGLDTLPNSSKILFNYNPKAVYEAYSDNPKLLLEQYRNTFPEKKFRRSKRSAWPQYVEGIISIARFLSEFETFDDFDNFVKAFLTNDYTIASLPMLLSMEIKGFGFALACDFLKESGYQDYGKPDVHLKEIFYKIHLVNSTNDLDIFRMIVKISKRTGENPSIIDKVFWLIGSGKFGKYNETHANQIPTKRLKDGFIRHINEKYR